MLIPKTMRSVPESRASCNGLKYILRKSPGLVHSLALHKRLIVSAGICRSGTRMYGLSVTSSLSSLGTSMCQGQWHRGWQVAAIAGGGGNQGHFLQLEYLELTSAGFGVQAATLNRRLRHSVTVPSAGCDSVVSSRCVTGDVTTDTFQSGNCLVGMLCATTATLMS